MNFWQKIHSRGPYKNGKNFVLSQNVLRKYFWAKFVVPLIKRKCFYKLLGCFWKIEFLTENPQPRTLQKWWKFCTISKCVKKIFFAKFFVPLIKRNVSTNFKAGFGKLNFWQKIHSRGPCKNGENFVLSQNVLRKYFLAKFFVPLIKRSVSTTIKAVFGKLNFLMENPQRGPYKKWWKFCTISKMC